MSSRKRIVVMGFMAGCPIAGVVWQHIHYIVGLQRLGHEVYYIEDSAQHNLGTLYFRLGRLEAAVRAFAQSLADCGR